LLLLYITRLLAETEKLRIANMLVLIDESGDPDFYAVSLGNAVFYTPSLFGIGLLAPSSANSASRWLAWMTV